MAESFECSEKYEKYVKIQNGTNHLELLESRTTEKYNITEQHWKTNQVVLGLILILYQMQDNIILF